MLRLKNLGSGSAGNATLIEGSDGLHTRRLLVDCGLGVRQLAARLDQAGVFGEGTRSLGTGRLTVGLRVDRFVAEARRAASKPSAMAIYVATLN